MKRTRDAQFTALIGKPGCGKSTLLKKIVDNQLAKSDRVIIVDPNLDEKTWYSYPFTEEPEKIKPNFTGAIAIPYVEKVTFPKIKKLIWDEGVKGVTLVLDDANVYSEGRPEQELRQLLMRKRQTETDIYTTGHSFGSIPQFFFRYITIWGIYPTLSPSKERAAVMGKDIYDQFAQIMTRINGQPDIHHVEFFNQFGEPLQ
jgi:energy-coupling factor transporter ATP-binding protein EcfA2